MYYYDEPLEEISEGHTSAVQQKNKDPSDFYNHNHTFVCVHEQKFGEMSVTINWCKTCGTVVKYYIDSEGHHVELFTKKPMTEKGE